jgi:hypothetical protein
MISYVCEVCGVATPPSRDGNVPTTWWVVNATVTQPPPVNKPLDPPTQYVRVEHRCPEHPFGEIPIGEVP